jgi:hypothetical protein
MDVEILQEVETPQTGRKHHSEQYRRDVIAEILHYGRAAAKNDSYFHHQLEAWAAALAKIPANELMLCYTLASRRREKLFDDEPLAAYELLAAWQNLKTNNQE